MRRGKRQRLACVLTGVAHNNFIEEGQPSYPVRPARLAMTTIRSCGSAGLGTWT
jgi:hypothetical protein